MLQYFITNSNFKIERFHNTERKHLQYPGTAMLGASQYGNRTVPIDFTPKRKITAARKDNKDC